MRAFFTILCLVLVISGCAHVAPRPLAPGDNVREFEARSLADAGLRAFVQTNAPDQAGAWPPTALDMRTLTLVAFYYHPDLDVARARVGAAEAVVTTAGARPNPALAWSPQYTANSPAGVSPWTLGFSLDIPIETAGKRGYRIKQARMLTEAARLDLAATAWSVRSRVRIALLDHLLAVRQLDVLRAEETVRIEAVTLMERRLAVGEVSRPDVDAARTEQTTTKIAIHAAQGIVAENHAALAAALGVPLSALDDVKLDWPKLDQPPGVPGMLQDAGLLNRLDVQRALVEYAAAEAALQLEIARQYPDVHLGPGYSWDRGDNKYSLGLSVNLPVLNQNQGPIAEAEARRKQLAAQFFALQTQVIGQTEQALARYRAALAECGEADRLVVLLKERENTMRLALQVGEVDQLALAGVRVQAAVAARSRIDALRKAQSALGALEDAVQRPLAEGR